MHIDKDLRYNKNLLLKYFRSRSNEIMSELSLIYSAADYKKKTSALNQSLTKSKENLISILLDNARKNKWTNIEILESVLMITYTNNIVMLETRNSIWEYDYMTFSRRIGELWEPFCKLCFYYSIKDINLFIPPLFSDVKRDLTQEIKDYITSLNLTEEERIQLCKYYDKVWGLVTSGEIQLECDLHFISENTKYVVDFKSGFGSNEKGNTNRLLLVGSIYKNIESENFKCMIFVRSTENNNYLTTLKNSGIWNTSCGNETYSKINHFTGYDIHNWIENNINWIGDFSQDMKSTIKSKELENYLIW